MRGTTAPDAGLATATVSRRSFVRTATAASVLAGSGVATGLLSTTPAMAAGSFVPSDPDLHLLRRATWGITPQLQKDIRQMGRNKWLDKQLDPNSINDAFVEDFVAERLPNLTMGVQEAYEAGSSDLMYDLTKAAILRAAWSKRQLFEVMVDFWSNHLNIANPHEACWWSRHDYDRKVIRKHAFGKFSNMLRASVLHPAMMAYLNNASSTKDNPNENYGREILELHSVGVDGGYNEEDMRQSTLILTGFGFSWDTGEFEYHPEHHYTGPIDVMGFHAKNDSANRGYDAALNYVDYLAHHRKTARRIATKLIQRFVQDNPPPSLVDTLADVYLHHDTAIKPVLEKLFDSAAFKHSAGKKVRRPFQDVTATIRTLGVGIKRNDEGDDALQQLSWLIEGLGDLPLAWIPPNGYPDYADAWRSAGITLGRWNMHVGIAQGWWPNALEIPEDWVPRLLGKKLPKTWGGLVDALSERLLFRKLSSEHRRAVLTFIEKGAGEKVDRDDDDGWLDDWRFPYLIALLLDSPYHGIR